MAQDDVAYCELNHNNDVRGMDAASFGIHHNDKQSFALE